MGNIASAGLSQVVDMVDETTGKAIEAIVALEDAAVGAIHGAVNVGDAAFDQAMIEVEEARGKLLVALRAAAAAVTAPLP